MIIIIIIRKKKELFLYLNVKNSQIKNQSQIKMHNFNDELHLSIARQTCSVTTR